MVGKFQPQQRDRDLNSGFLLWLVSYAVMLLLFDETMLYGGID